MEHHHLCQEEEEGQLLEEDAGHRLHHRRHHEEVDLAAVVRQCRHHLQGIDTEEAIETWVRRLRMVRAMAEDMLRGVDA